jgi:carbon monoxide dehydrogenase subunit G
MAHDRRGRRSDSDGSGGPARLSLLLVALLLGVTDARAGELIELTVEHSDGRYLLSAHLMVDAPPEAVRRRLTDYANLSALSPSIMRSDVTRAREPYDARVRTLIKACVLLYCRTLRRVEDVREEPGRLFAVIVPELSDFAVGQTEWRLQPRGSGVRVLYRSELEPAFAVPPVLGAALVEQGLESELRALLQNLERLGTD